MTQPKQEESNALGIASLILGILSVTAFSILTGIPAIITGVMGLKHPASKGMSIAGIIMGAVSVVLALLAVLFIIILIIIGASTDKSIPPYDDPGQPVAPIAPYPYEGQST